MYVLNGPARTQWIHRVRAGRGGAVVADYSERKGGVGALS